MARKRHREYDEREVSFLLERAAELQGSTALVPVGGIRTFDELKAIVREAGMDAASLEAAAQELERTSAAKVPLIGRSPRVEVITTVEGMLDEEDRRELLGIIRRSLDAGGSVRETGNGFEWRRFGTFGRELVVVSAHKGKTRIEVRGRYRRGFLATFLSAGFVAGTATLGLLDLLHLLRALDGFALFPVLGAAFYAGRTLWNWFGAAKERLLGRLADRLGDFTEEHQQPLLPPKSED
jgi:hypothetical protein